MKAIAAACAALALAGCATKPVPMTAAVRIPVPCIDPRDLPARPDFMTEAELADLDAADVPIALELQRLKALAYIRELEAVAQGCSRLPSDPRVG